MFGADLWGKVSQVVFFLCVCVLREHMFTTILWKIDLFQRHINNPKCWGRGESSTKLAQYVISVSSIMLIAGELASLSCCTFCSRKSLTNDGTHYQKTHISCQYICLLSIFDECISWWNSWGRATIAHGTN